MASQNACGMKIGIGLVASRIGARNAFRYCRQCCAEDEQLHGSAYWHRAHSLPGVLVCHRHKDVLMELRSSLVHLHRHRLFLPTDSWVEEWASATHVPTAHLEELFRLAASSAYLLASHATNPGALLLSLTEKADGLGRSISAAAYLALRSSRSDIRTGPNPDAIWNLRTAFTVSSCA